METKLAGENTPKSSFGNWLMDGSQYDIWRLIWGNKTKEKCKNIKGF
jgi:hypothetical protein